MHYLTTTYDNLTEKISLNNVASLHASIIHTLPHILILCFFKTLVLACYGEKPQGSCATLTQTPCEAH